METPYLFYGTIEVLFVLLFLVPETKGISLEKIEANLMSGKLLKKDWGFDK